MNINCELPLCMLSENETLNQCNFVLFHLYKSNSAYREYYKNLRESKSAFPMILDNSGYEFACKGLEIDIDEYIDVINDLKPSMYIIPDVLMDKNATLDHVRNWMSEHISKVKCNAEPMAVIQGNTYKEMEECAAVYMNELKIRCIAVPFHNSFYADIKNILPDVIRYLVDEIRKHNPMFVLDEVNYRDILYAAGRITYVLTNKTINENFSDLHYIHLLGSHCPFEKAVYDKFTFKGRTSYADLINSMDTGYPVKCAMFEEGYMLGNEPFKPDILIDDFFDQKIDDYRKSLILYNVSKFKML